MESPIVDNPALTTALKAFTSLTREQKAVLSRTLDGFIACLAPASTDVHHNPHSRTVITEKAWLNRAAWGRDEWNAWETWGWYRQFCRAVRGYLIWGFSIVLIGRNSIHRISATMPQRFRRCPLLSSMARLTPLLSSLGRHGMWLQAKKRGHDCTDLPCSSHLYWICSLFLIPMKTKLPCGSIATCLVQMHQNMLLNTVSNCPSESLFFFQARFSLSSMALFFGRSFNDFSGNSSPFSRFFSARLSSTRASSTFFRYSCCSTLDCDNSTRSLAA